MKIYENRGTSWQDLFICSLSLSLSIYIYIYMWGGGSPIGEFPHGAQAWALWVPRPAPPQALCPGPGLGPMVPRPRPHGWGNPPPHTYIHTCMHAYIHTYIHTYTYIYIYIYTYGENMNDYQSYPYIFHLSLYIYIMFPNYFYFINFPQFDLLSMFLFVHDFFVCSILRKGRILMHIT